MGHNAFYEGNIHDLSPTLTSNKNTLINVNQPEDLQLKSFILCRFHLQVLNGQTHLTSTQAAANSHHSNGLPACHVASSSVEGWTADHSAGRESSTAGSQSFAGRGGRGRREHAEEVRGQTHPLEVLSGHPSSLDSILGHIVQQLDILTQVSHL